VSRSNRTSGRSRGTKRRFGTPWSKHGQGPSIGGEAGSRFPASFCAAGRQQQDSSDRRRAIEKAGGIVVATENCTGLKPILEDVDEAEQGEWTPNFGDYVTWNMFERKR